MKKIVGFAGLMILFFSCGRAEWANRYTSTNCMTLEYVEFYEDNTADIKYFGARFPTNHKLKRNGNLFFVNIYKLDRLFQP
jgi:hypothetical protein